jgi:multiple sugar transport system permease protein
MQLGFALAAKTRRPQTSQLPRVLGLGAIMAWILFPIYWTLNTSLMTRVQAGSLPPQYLPLPPYFGNYRDLFAGGSGFSVPRVLLNSVIEGGGATILVVLISLTSAYAFAHLKFPLRRTLLTIVIGTFLLPGISTLVPLFALMSRVGLVNTYLGVILALVATFVPLGMWIMYQYMLAIPGDLIEAARIDGASEIAALARIILPLAVPGIAATGILTFLSCWAAFLVPVILGGDPSIEPITLAVFGLQGREFLSVPLINAASIVAVLLPALLVVTLNRYIIAGLTAGSRR